MTNYVLPPFVGSFIVVSATDWTNQLKVQEALMDIWKQNKTATLLLPGMRAAEDMASKLWRAMSGPVTYWLPQFVKHHDAKQAFQERDKRMFAKNPSLVLWFCTANDESNKTAWYMARKAENNQIPVIKIFD